jgi:hypothetical protein
MMMMMCLVLMEVVSDNLLIVLKLMLAQRAMITIAEWGSCFVIHKRTVGVVMY